MKKKSEMNVVYTYIEPKTPEEAEMAQCRQQRAYDIIFDATLKKMEDEGYAPEFLDKFR